MQFSRSASIPRASRSWATTQPTSRRALRDGLGADLCAVSGGLGPTHDDRTVEMVARAAGVGLVVDDGLEAQIEAVSRSYAERLGRPYADFAHGVRKQATLPEGAVSIGLAGTAPGFVLQSGGAVFVVLPGPPGELQRLWPAALETEAIREIVARARPRERQTLRLYGVSESTVARTLYEAGGDGGGVDVTVCARDFEIHVDMLVEPGAEERAETLTAALRAEHDRHAFSEDERPVEELVLALARALGLTIGTAESCTGGLVAERLTSIGGSSDVFVGGIVAYSNAVKEEQLGVSPDVLSEHGAVSAETAAAMAHGVRERLGVDVGLAVTGVAGPGGRHPGETGRPRVRACGDSRCRPGHRLQLSLRPGVDPPSRGRRGASSRQASLVTESARFRVTDAATVAAHERLRLFCGLTLPESVREALATWQRHSLRSAARTVEPRNLHITLAFLGPRPVGEVGPIAEALGAAAGSLAEPIRLDPERYRETRSVGMLVLADEQERAGRLARSLHERLERLGVYKPETRPWLPHVTVLRFRSRPRLQPPLPDLSPFSPSGAAVYHSVLARGGARYEVLESVPLGG